MISQYLIRETFCSEKLEKVVDNENINHSLIPLENVVNSLPGMVYWKNVKGSYLGRNHMADQTSVGT